MPWPDCPRAEIRLFFGGAVFFLVYNTLELHLQRKQVICVKQAFKNNLLFSSVVQGDFAKK